MTSNELKHKARLQEWALTVQECRSSGKPVKQWCIENKIKTTTYYRWEREILGDAEKNRNKPERSGKQTYKSESRGTDKVSHQQQSSCYRRQRFIQLGSGGNCAAEQQTTDFR